MYTRKNPYINHYEKDPYNDHQNFLYNRALHGLNIYSKKELNELTVEKKKRILRIYKKTQYVLNLWKQELVNEMANALFMNLFPRMSITQEILHFGIEGDETYINKLSFKMLKINKSQIIEKLIENKLLPKNFNQLEQTYENRISH